MKGFLVLCLRGTESVLLWQFILRGGLGYNEVSQ